jgi:hypothetical protein
MNAKTQMEVTTIFPAMVRITRSIAESGIGKTRKNKQQDYNFRGVDEVMNAFAPILAKEGIFIQPHFANRQVSERVTKSGAALYSVSVEGTFDFVAEDGSSVTVGPFFGEAMDSGDKATNKAMAVAFKYAMFQTFCVPLEGVTGGDADATTHDEIVSEEAATVQEWLDAINATGSSADLDAMGKEIAGAKLSSAGKLKLRAAFATRKHAFDKAAA